MGGPQETAVISPHRVGGCGRKPAHKRQDGSFDPTAAGFQGCCGSFRIGVCREHHGPFTAGPQFFIGGAEVNHEVAVHLARPDHGTGAERVKDKLLRGTGFEPGAARQQLRTHFGFNGTMGRGPDR